MGALMSVHTNRHRRFLAHLRQARKDAGLTQVEVARRMRRPQSWVSKCETEERRIDAVEFADLAALYGKPMEWFVRKGR